jgi:hypothetical protein
MSTADSEIDDYVDVVRYVRDLGDHGGADIASRRLVRALRPDAGTTLASLVQGDTLDPIVLVAPSGTGKTTEFRQQARRRRASGRAAAFAEASSILASPEMDLDTNERGAFKGLLESPTPGVLFVDAIEELYLRQQTFEQLFRRLEREVGFEAHPTRLIFSARNGAWISSSTRELRCLLKRIAIQGRPKVSDAIRARAALEVRGLPTRGARPRSPPETSGGRDGGSRRGIDVDVAW